VEAGGIEYIGTFTWGDPIPDWWEEAREAFTAYRG
jgi:hypothetical protein